MFDDPLYELNARWRSKPASDKQLKKLKELGAPYSPDVTKGEATDLIAQHAEPDAEELAFLSHFGVALHSDATQFQARQAIQEIVADEANRKIWDSRPATEDLRKDVVSRFGSAPEDLTYADAEAMLLGFESHAAMEAFERAEEEKEAAEDAKLERKETVKFLTEQINDYVREDPHIFGIRKVTQKLVSQACANIERARNMTLTELFLEEVALDDLIVAEIKRIAPDHILDAAAIQEAQRKAAKRYGAPPRESASGSGWIWLVVIAGVLLLVMSQ